MPIASSPTVPDRVVFTLALLQTNGADNAEENARLLRTSFSMFDEPVEVVALPECANFVEKNPEKAREKWTTEENDVFLQTARELAVEYGVWMQLGSLVIKDPNHDRAFNRSFVIDDAGDIAGRYDKLHLFDVDLPDGSQYRESAHYQPGKQPVIVDTPYGRWGLSICFDIRFPKLYQHYREQGVDIFFTPAAFTVPTGQSHWEVLQRARAIENQRWVVAAGQVGEHQDGRKTYGHSMMINPWGDVVSILRDRIDTLYWRIDLGEIDRVEASMPLSSSLL